MSDTKYCNYLDNQNQDLENPEHKDDQDYYYDNDDYDDDKYTTYKFTDYEKLLVLTKQEETKFKINNIIFALMKVIIIKKYNEVSFTPLDI